MRETAAEKGLDLPDSADLERQMGWTLHGGISDFAARRHIFGGSRSLPEATVISLHVRLFLAGFEEMLASARGI